MLFEIGDDGDHFIADKLLGGLADEFLIVRQFSGREDILRDAGLHQKTSTARSGSG
jgi:hypothetical protein